MNPWRKKNSAEKKAPKNTMNREAILDFQDGLILLAAHAPSEIPSWFKVNTPDLQPLSAEDLHNYEPDTRAEDVDLMRKWMRGEITDDVLPERLSAARKELKERTRSLNGSSHRGEVVRYFAWRYYYAKKMLENFPGLGSQVNTLKKMVASGERQLAEGRAEG